jgi:GTP-binding protein
MQTGCFFMKKKPTLVDEARIFVEGGRGGNGCISFLREKYRPYGGPDGGSGGKGGDVVLIADRQLHTLLDLKYRKSFRAGKGAHGQGKNKTGSNGRDRIIHVPCGTVVVDQASDEVIGDLVTDGYRCIVARGGAGGSGNAVFASATDRAPRICTPGEPGESRWLFLELKFLADLGIVGLPNAGKSSFLSKISAAHPKIASYPFTTLTPHLGVLTFENGTSVVIADIPGLIEGAHQGLGLGDQFLRHVERTQILLHMVDIATPFHGDPVTDYEVIESELRKSGRNLDKKIRIVVMNKIDCAGTGQNGELLAGYLDPKGIPVFRISALTGEGIQSLLDFVVTQLKESPDRT